MSAFVDGEWRTDGREMMDEKGTFQREETTFRDRIRDAPDAEFQAAPGRYHLYVARPCPWAHGVVLARTLLGLEDVITMDIVDPYRGSDGWQFSPNRVGCTPDTVNGAEYLRDIYLAADPSYTGRVSVPVLWDRQRETIVNNESIEIMRMLAMEFNEQAHADVELYPPSRRNEIDRIVDDIYRPVNNGVYRAGFAGTQEAYDRAVGALFGALDELNERLTDRRYLAGERLTLADLRLFPTLVRFDEVYHTHFKCNRQRLIDYEQLWEYTRELYQLPGVSDTVNMDHIKEHYYTTHESINPRRIVPIGPDPDFEASHDRDRLPGGPPEGLVE